MAEIGYVLSCEEHSAPDLVHNAHRAEECGFVGGLISDHYHPWTDRQGNSPFVWSVAGAIARATEQFRLGTGVTCPIIRIHPAIIAQAAATVATMMPGRFFLGVGAGENLNEHILGDRWPPPSVRLEMLEEAIEVIRKLWQGGQQSHHGRHFTVEDARVYNLPDELPPILMAAGGRVATKLAGQVADGMIGTVADAHQVSVFDAAGGKGKLRFGKIIVCWAEGEEKARRTAHEWFPNAAMGAYALDIRLPQHFQQIALGISDDAIAEAVVCGPDPRRHVAAIKEYFDVGYELVFVHQIGPDQEAFLRFYEREVLPTFQRSLTGAGDGR